MDGETSIDTGPATITLFRRLLAGKPNLAPSCLSGNAGGIAIAMVGGRVIGERSLMLSECDKASVFNNARTASLPVGGGGG